MKDGKITRWFKQEGDSVNKGENLFEVETEKITKKVESPAGISPGTAQLAKRP